MQNTKKICTVLILFSLLAVGLAKAENWEEVTFGGKGDFTNNLSQVFGIPSPENNSLNQQLSLTWQIEINDLLDKLTDTK